jgi:DNA helicase-2/ATP-dependent DNA helicase PcrA
MFIPTDEQLKILTSSHRIRIVQACPGSGKTSLFVEHVKRLIENWPHKRRGIAALSFTNAASREIYGRIGESLSFPHFLGTLDSFMLRYVVSPFGSFAGICEDGANLVPAPMDKRLLYPVLKF